MSVIESLAKFVKKVLAAHPVGSPPVFAPCGLSPTDGPSVEFRIVFVTRYRENGIRKVIFNCPVGIVIYLEHIHRCHRKVLWGKCICHKVSNDVPRVNIENYGHRVIKAHTGGNVSACNVPSSDPRLLVYMSGSHLPDRRLTFLCHSDNHVSVKYALCFRGCERFCFLAGILLLHVLFGTHSLKIEYRNRIFRSLVPLFISSGSCVPRNEESFPPVVGSCAVEFLK